MFLPSCWIVCGLEMQNGSKGQEGGGSQVDYDPSLKVCLESVLDILASVLLPDT